ncbi:biotin/lipoyl-binding protein [Massilia sp. H-1]|nr:biotin/lipoyl-binding protein [Massilia sp. H-1]
MSGNVARESNRKAIQHLTGGTIDEILVREGETVKAGQVLVRMNGVQAGAQADVTRVQYFAARGPRRAWWPSATARTACPSRRR